MAGAGGGFSGGGLGISAAGKRRSGGWPGKSSLLTGGCGRKGLRTAADGVAGGSGFTPATVFLDDTPPNTTQMTPRAATSTTMPKTRVVRDHESSSREDDPGAPLPVAVVAPVEVDETSGRPP